MARRKLLPDFRFLPQFDFGNKAQPFPCQGVVQGDPAGDELLAGGSDGGAG